jgi:hypothetical protein
MRERFGFVEEHQIDRPCYSLGFQIGEVLTAGLNRGCVLAPFEGVARATEGKWGGRPPLPSLQAG